MQHTLTFYTHPQSRGRIARWMLEESGLPYEEVIVGFGTDMKAPAYLAVNPMGKVPALRHDDTVITENAAICLHLADVATGAGLIPPPGDAARGACYRWLMIAAGPLEALVTAQRQGPLAPPMHAGYGTGADLLAMLEQALAGRRFVVGDRFTVVDLYLAGLLGFYLRIGALASNPVFAGYAAYHLERAAAQRAFARDDALSAQLA